MSEFLDSTGLDEKRRRELVGLGVVAAIMATVDLGSPKDFRGDVDTLLALGLVNNGLPQRYLDLLRSAGVVIPSPVGNRSGGV